MVVVSGSWVKNVPTFPTAPSILNQSMMIQNTTIAIDGHPPATYDQEPNPPPNTIQRQMTAKAVLICRPNSHQFQKRTLDLDQPVKIGRSVARAKPTDTNAIFDCKVLSRHHAMIYYESGNFFLQDTKSSNGTFVNNHKLQINENHELSSGDIVQFGVDVIENNKKVTHGCIIATVKLFLPDGKEAKASATGMHDAMGVVPLDALYHLNQIIQEANQREQCLETKLSALQLIVDETRKSAEESWQAYVGEEKLLSRLSVLESQLQQASRNFGEDNIREELSKLQDHNQFYQVAAKEALEKLHADCLKAEKFAHEQERSRISAEQEAILANEQLAQIKFELNDVLMKLSEENQRKEEERQALEQFDLFHSSPPLSDEEQHIIMKNMEDDLKCKQEKLGEVDSWINNSPLIEDENHLKNGDGYYMRTKPKPIKEEVEDEQDEKQDNSENTDELKESSENDCTMESNGTVDLNETAIEIEAVDSKTLKYQFQSVEKELKRKIAILEFNSNENRNEIQTVSKQLNESLDERKKLQEENDSLKSSLETVEKSKLDCSLESEELKTRVGELTRMLESHRGELRQRVKDGATCGENSSITYQQVVDLEDELVRMKERFDKVGDENVKLKHDLSHMTQQYNVMCNASYNRIFFYCGPLVLIILYLLISRMVS